MKFHRTILILTLLPLLLSGCAHNALERDRLASQINVFGVGPYSDVDYREINGVVATEEPCLKGYERSFDALDIIIGYGFNKKIRKITTRNAGTSMFGVRPGMTFDEGKKWILQAGFSEYLPPFTYRANRYTLKLLVGKDNKIFGVTLETLD
jgi:hypothetical protein